MSADKDLIEYDEDEAVKFIQNYLPQDLKNKFSNDEINYIIDIIYEFYEDKGLMNLDVQEDQVVEIDEEEMISFVLKNTRKDKINNFTAEEVTFIIQGELAYCDTLNVFEK